MKYCIKIISLSFIFLFIFSCANSNDFMVKLDKYIGRYEGVLNTTEKTKQVTINKCTLIVNENSIDITIESENGNEYDDILSISKEELTKVADDSFNANKNGKKYNFNFNDTYVNLTIENKNGSLSEGNLSKIS